MLKIYVTSGTIASGGGTEAVAVVNPHGGPVVVRHVEVEAYPLGVDPGGYADEGAQYVEGNIATANGTRTEYLPDNKQRPLRLWANDRPGGDFLIPKEGSVLNLTNRHPKDGVVVALVLHVSPAGAQDTPAALRMKVRR